MDHLVWPVERLILEHVATFREIEEYYSIDDIADRNDALDAWHEAQARAERKAQGK